MPCTWRQRAAWRNSFNMTMWRRSVGLPVAQLLIQAEESSPSIALCPATSFCKHNSMCSSIWSCAGTDAMSSSAEGALFYEACCMESSQTLAKMAQGWMLPARELASSHISAAQLEVKLEGVTTITFFKLGRPCSACLACLLQPEFLTSIIMSGSCHSQTQALAWVQQTKQQKPTKQRSTPGVEAVPEALVSARSI